MPRVAPSRLHQLSITPPIAHRPHDRLPPATPHALNAGGWQSAPAQDRQPPLSCETSPAADDGAREPADGAQGPANGTATVLSDVDGSRPPQMLGRGCGARMGPELAASPGGGEDGDTSAARVSLAAALPCNWADVEDAGVPLGGSAWGRDGAGASPARGARGGAGKPTPVRVVDNPAGSAGGPALGPALLSWNDHFYHFVLFRAVRGGDAKPRADADGSFGGDIGERELALWVARQNRARRGYDTRGPGKGEGRLTPERIKALDSLNFPWSRKHGEGWEECFLALVQHKEKHGHLNLSSSEEGKPALGAWAASQRSAYKRRMEGKTSSLTPERIERLEGIGFEWTVRKAEPWECQFQRLVEFHSRHGHCNVPRSEGALYAWVHSQTRVRKRLDAGGSPRRNEDGLTPERIARLDCLGFRWVRERSGRWEARFRELVEYKERHRHCNVASREPGGLGSWAMRQRAAYEQRRLGKPSVLTEEQIGRMEGIGFAWTVKLDHATAWEIKFDQLKKFFEENGHCLVPVRQGTLGKWVDQQRDSYKKKLKGEQSPMTEARIERLEGIGFQWTVQQFGKDTVKKFLDSLADTESAQQEDDWTEIAYDPSPN